MTDEVKTPRTIQAIQADMQVALSKGDMKALGVLSKEFTAVQKASEAAELKAKQDALTEKWTEVYETLFGADGLIRSMVDTGELDVADGLWIAWDFGEKEEKGINPSLKFFKKSSTGEKKTGTGGGGHSTKGLPRTEELLKEHGEEVMNSETGETFNSAYESAKGDGNKVYQVRVKLLKHLNIS